MRTALVTDAARGSAVSFIRSLRRAGFVVIAGDDRRVSAGRWSRSASSSFVYPDPYVDPIGAADELLAQVVEHSVDVLLPMTDATIRVATTLAGRLPERCRVGTPPPEAAAIAADKFRTVELARSVGVPVPATVVVDTPEAAVAVGDSLGWPVVVKPSSSLGLDAGGAMRKLEVGYGYDAQDLERAVRTLGMAGPVLLQECCRGEGVGVEVLADRGRIVRAFSHRRIHEVPVTGGASALRESIELDPDLLDYSARLVSGLHWTGLAMVEFKSGSSGYRLMEINGRPWGSLPLAVRSGVDFPADYARMLLGDRSGPADLAPVTDYTIGTVARNLRLESAWIVSVLRGPPEDVPDGWPPRREALRALIRLASPRVTDDILSLRDPLPGVAELLSIGLKAVRKTGGR